MRFAVQPGLLFSAVLIASLLGCSEGGFAPAPCPADICQEPSQTPANPTDPGPPAYGGSIDDETQDWTDDDGDGVLDRIDNCPNVSNPDQADLDGDMHGDVCDNCPRTANVDQIDADGNGIGDVCQEEDHYETSQDTDGDGIADTADNCISVPNPLSLIHI